MKYIFLPFLLLIPFYSAFSYEIELAWDPSPSTNVGGYHIYVGTNSGNYSSFQDVGLTLSTKITVPEGETYFFVATAYDDTKSLESIYSNEISADVPFGIPSSLSVASSTKSSVTLSWSKEQNAAGYEIHYGTSAGQYSSKQSVENSESVLTISDLLEGQKYFFALRILGSSSALDSPFSNEVNFQAPFAAPTVPSNLRLISLSKDSANLSWSASSGKVGGYEVLYGTSSGSLSQTKDIGNSLNATISNLSEATTYFFRVRAYHSEANLRSNLSNLVSGTTDRTISLSAPRNLSVVSATSSSALLSWNLPEVGTADLGGFKVLIGTSSKTYSRSIDVGSVTQAEVANLSAGKTYFFAVSAVSKDGSVTSPLSNEVFQSISLDAPGAPVNLRVLSSAERSATLGWAAPTSSASDLGGYKVYYGKESGNYIKSVDVGTSLTATISELEPGATYFFIVRTYHSKDKSLLSLPSSEVSHQVKESTLLAPLQLRIVPN